MPLATAGSRRPAPGTATQWRAEPISTYQHSSGSPISTPLGSLAPNRVTYSPSSCTPCLADSACGSTRVGMTDSATPAGRDGYRRGRRSFDAIELVAETATLRSLTPRSSKK